MPDSPTCELCGGTYDERGRSKVIVEPGECPMPHHDPAAWEALANALRTAFVNGAKWWEFQSQGATMWQSDQNIAWDEASKRLASGTLTYNAALRARLTNPEEHQSNPPEDCRHHSARCADCGWPLWTHGEVADIEQSSDASYHKFHAGEHRDDCVYCEVEALRARLEEEGGG